MSPSVKMKIREYIDGKDISIENLKFIINLLNDLESYNILDKMYVLYLPFEEKNNKIYNLKNPI